MLYSIVYNVPICSVMQYCITTTLSLLQNVAIDVVALVNDTTGTQMAVGIHDPDCYVGVILGTGTNACYLEDLQAVKKHKGEGSDHTHVIINTEWGAFGDDGSLEKWRTSFDRDLDALAKNKLQQTYACVDVYGVCMCMGMCICAWLCVHVRGYVDVCVTMCICAWVCGCVRDYVYILPIPPPQFWEDDIWEVPGWDGEDGVGQASGGWSVPGWKCLWQASHATGFRILLSLGDRDRVSGMGINVLRSLCGVLCVYVFGYVDVSVCVMQSRTWLYHVRVCAVLCVCVCHSPIIELG